MADPNRHYITTPIKDTELQHFAGRIEQYEVRYLPYMGAGLVCSLNMFMRECVCNRLFHDMDMPESSSSESEDDG